MFSLLYGMSAYLRIQRSVGHLATTWILVRLGDLLYLACGSCDITIHLRLHSETVLYV